MNELGIARIHAALAADSELRERTVHLSDAAKLKRTLSSTDRRPTGS